MDNIKLTYLNMFYENINTNVDKLNINNYQQWLNNLIIFDKNFNIIKEDKNNVFDIPDQLITKLLSLDNFDKLYKNEISQLLSFSKHKFNIKHKIKSDLIFCKFDFNKREEIDNFHLTLFNIDDIETLNQCYKMFLQHCQYAYGLISKSNNNYILIVNTKASSLYQTIYHELSHYLQKICGIHLPTISILTKNNVLFNKLNIDEKYFNYLLKPEEFTVHIDETITGLDNLYKYKKLNINKYEFLMNIINTLQNNIDDDHFYQNSIIKDYNDANNNITGIVFLYLVIKLKIKWIYVFNYLSKYFK